ncbi:hypothetical protein [Methylobacterium gregans]|uniref:hypothetical protein n=1 Tax=Methylobacterium gregans TaxID=374424 RepID=UPI003609ADAD
MNQISAVSQVDFRAVALRSMRSPPRSGSRPRACMRIPVVPYLSFCAPEAG